MPARPLSNLEFTVLGLTWLRGPCTVYAVMKELSLSASSYHKSRAGTAYSIARRLIEFGFLAVGDDERVTVTESGVAQLRQWLTPPMPMTDVSHSADLIRLRFFFLEVIEPQERVRFIDSALEGLEAFLAQCEALLPENERIGDYFGVLATVSTLFETRARIAWLRLVREWVLEPMPDGQSWTDTVNRRLRDVLP